jgi:acyl-ACP thioesterase
VSRVFRAAHPIRLSDTDASGRLRLDAVARYLQDVASDDWADAGLDAGETAWVVRKTEIDVAAPFTDDTRVELATWCSGVGAAAASRRYSVAGDRGGRIEAESVWIHLDWELRPLRLGERFLAVFGPSAGARGVATRLALPALPVGAEEEPWPLRRTDIDRLGHVNNAVYWQAVEEIWGGRVRKAVLEYRKPIDLEDEVVLAHEDDLLWLAVAGDVRSAARVE